MTTSSERTRRTARSRAPADRVAAVLAAATEDVIVATDPTGAEYKLLYQLVRNAGRLLPRAALLDRVWGSDYDASPEYLKVFVSRLRAKLRRSGGPEYIQTERGQGYRFIKPVSRPAARVAETRPFGDEPQPAVWLSVEQIDPSPETRNSRRVYDQTRLGELADSIRAQGILQPIVVTPVGDRYEVIAGNRRLRAAKLVGLAKVPAVVRPDLDEGRRLLVNLVENAQRVDLSPTERIEAVRQLAAAGLGVREVARGTGLSAGTVSRWIRIADNVPLLRALEEGRIDLFHAMHVGNVRDKAVVEELIAVAAEYTPEAFYSLVQQRVSGSNTRVNRDERRLALVLQRLSLVESVTPAALEHLQQIVEAAQALIERGRSSSTSGMCRDLVASNVTHQPVARTVG